MQWTRSSASTLYTLTLFNTSFHASPSTFHKLENAGLASKLLLNKRKRCQFQNCLYQIQCFFHYFSVAVTFHFIEKHKLTELKYMTFDSKAYYLCTISCYSHICCTTSLSLRIPHQKVFCSFAK